MSKSTYCLRCGGFGLIRTALGSVTCPVCLGDGKPTVDLEELHQQQIEDAVGAIVQSEVDEMSEPMKALCVHCFDKYGDEELCFGRCCGSPMVEVPKYLWDAMDSRCSREEIKDLIEKRGVSLIKE